MPQIISQNTQKALNHKTVFKAKVRNSKDHTSETMTSHPSNKQTNLAPCPSQIRDLSRQKLNKNI